jgi:ABC-2 type transporter
MSYIRFGIADYRIFILITGTAQPALLSFPSERPVFLREYSTNHYSVLSYFVSRFTMEAVVTGVQVMVMVSNVDPVFSSYFKAAFLSLFALYIFSA